MDRFIFVKNTIVSFVFKINTRIEKIFRSQNILSIGSSRRIFDEVLPIIIVSTNCHSNEHVIPPCVHTGYVCILFSIESSHSRPVLEREPSVQYEPLCCRDFTFNVTPLDTRYL